ncbi:MAG: hypothetical protein ACI857_002184 [Arenicella sp.]|jgi:hypothetical protein
MMKSILLFSSFLFIFNSQACVCSDFNFFPSVSEEFLDQDEYQMFTGKVLNIEVIAQPTYKDTTGLSEYEKSQTRRFQRVTIEVFKSYGNQITMDTIQIATGFGGPDCGVSFFKKKKKFLFTVGTKPEGQEYFWTSICVPNKELKKAKEDIVLIEKAGI